VLVAVNIGFPVQKAKQGRRGPLSFAPFMGGEFCEEGGGGRRHVRCSK